jgi:hypothetical protein
MPLAEMVLIPWVPDRRVRDALAMAIIFIPALFFSKGRVDAYWIKHGNADALVDIARSQLPLNASEEYPVAYLGHLGEFFILYETATRSVVLIPANGSSRLCLKHNQRHVMRFLAARVLPNGSIGHSDARTVARN